MLIFSDEPQITTEPPTQQAVHTKYDHSKESEVESLESHISPTQCITGAFSIHENTVYSIFSIP